jgi:hypothetical protein
MMIRFPFAGVFNLDKLRQFIGFQIHCFKTILFDHAQIKVMQS